MKNFSFSEVTADGLQVLATSFLYPDMGISVLTGGKSKNHSDNKALRESEKPPPGPSPLEIKDLLTRARGEAIAETEKRIRVEYEARLDSEAAKIRETLELFEVERKAYFTRVESEVVHLALAIAAKVLHREAQVDPLLVAALVRVAVDKLHDGSSVSVRVPSSKAEKWRERMANPLNGSTIAIVEDPHLALDDCILETDLGSANFSIDAQLKEVEQGFFDLLAQRPPTK